MEKQFDVYLEYAQKLAPFLGKEVRSGFISDENTKQYLIGLEYLDHPFDRFWSAKVRFICNGCVEEKYIDIKTVEPVYDNKYLDVNPYSTKISKKVKK